MKTWFLTNSYEFKKRMNQFFCMVYTSDNLKIEVRISFCSKKINIVNINLWFILSTFLRNAEVHIKVNSNNLKIYFSINFEIFWSGFLLWFYLLYKCWTGGHCHPGVGPINRYPVLDKGSRYKWKLWKFSICINFQLWFILFPKWVVFIFLKYKILQ